MFVFQLLAKYFTLCSSRIQDLRSSAEQTELEKEKVGILRRLVTLD